MSEYSCHKKIIFTIIAIGVLTVFGVSSLLFGDEPVIQASGNRGYIFCKDTSPEKKKDNCIIRPQVKEKASCPRRMKIKRCKNKEEKLSLIQKEARRDAKEGASLKQAGNLEEARVAYQKAVLKDPAYAKAHNELGAIYEMLGMQSLAEKSFLRAVEVNKCYLSAYSNLVSLYEKKGDLVNAALYWEKIIQLETEEISRDILQESFSK